MPKFNERNERIKREYIDFLCHAEGYDEASLDKVRAALRDFEEAVGYKPFKSFHRDWAARFKKHLDNRKNARTGKPLGVSTRDSMLRQVKAFIRWLASQPGYRSRVSPADVAYFNNTMKDARAAHAQRPARYPSIEQCDHAFRQMPEDDEIQRRDKAMFALIMLTGARAGAVASLRLKHVDLVSGSIYQDGREMRTKAAKSFETWFFPVDPMYRVVFSEWIEYLRSEKLYGPDDAVFPKLLPLEGGEFGKTGLGRAPYANSQMVSKVVKRAFRTAGLHEFNPHSIRRTLAFLGDRLCKSSREAWKAWTQNLGHEREATTLSAYMPVSRERQAELLGLMRPS